MPTLRRMQTVGDFILERLIDWGIKRVPESAADRFGFRAKRNVRVR